MPSAKDILQTYLDQMGQAVMTGDFAAYADGIALPFTLPTAGGDIIVEPQEELATGLKEFRDMLTSQKTTDLLRTVLNAEFQSDSEILGHYETNILSDGKRTFPVWPSGISLVHQDDHWRATWITNDMDAARWPVNMPFSLTKKMTPPTTKGNT